MALNDGRSDNNFFGEKIKILFSNKRGRQAKKLVLIMKYFFVIQFANSLVIKKF